MKTHVSNQEQPFLEWTALELCIPLYLLEMTPDMSYKSLFIHYFVIQQAPQASTALFPDVDETLGTAYCEVTLEISVQHRLALVHRLIRAKIFL